MNVLAAGVPVDLFGTGNGLHTHTGDQIFAAILNIGNVGDKNRLILRLGCYRQASAYNRVAAAARAALSASGTGTAGSIPGYAVGTQSAAPGFALVGENGPELVYFNGGEQVMTAEETAAMRESMEIQAITFAPQLLEALHAIHGDGALSAEPGAGSGAGSVELQIVFQINGSASPETVEALREYGDEFAERVLEVMEEAGIDTARRAYK